MKKHISIIVLTTMFTSDVFAGEGATIRIQMNRVGSSGIVTETHQTPSSVSAPVSVTEKPTEPTATVAHKPEDKRPNWFVRNSKGFWNTFVAPSPTGTVRSFRSPHGGGDIVIATSTSERVHKSKSEGVSQSFYGGGGWHKSSSYTYEKRSDPVLGVPSYMAPREYFRVKVLSSDSGPSRQDLTPKHQQIPAGTVRVNIFGR